MEKLKNGFFTNGYFFLGEEGEIDTNRFFKNSDELAKFIDKILGKYDDHSSIYYTEGENVIYLVETDAFSNVSTIFSIKTLVQSISSS